MFPLKVIYENDVAWKVTSTKHPSGSL